MVQIVVGPFTHHDAVEAFSFKFRILKSEARSYHSIKSLTRLSRNMHSRHLTQQVFVWLPKWCLVTAMTTCTIGNVRPLTASVWFRVDGLGLGKINTADFAVPHRCADAGHHPPLLQVGLSIQVGRLDVTHAAWVWRVQEQQVCWDGLIANYLDKISHSHILPAPLYKILCFPKTRDTKYQQSLQMVFKKDTDFNIDFCHIY